MTSWSLYFCLCLFHMFIDVSTAQGCSLQPANGGLAYRQYVPGSGTIVRSCPPGTSFSVASCSCSIFTNRRPSERGFNGVIQPNFPRQSINDQFSNSNKSVQPQQRDIGHSSTTGGRNPIRRTMVGGDVNKNQVQNPIRRTMVGGDINKSQVQNTPTWQEQKRAVYVLLNGPDPGNHQNELQGGVFDWRQHLFSGTKPNLASLFPMLMQNSINKQKGQRDILLPRDQSSLFQKNNAANETQAPKPRKVAPESTLRPEIRAPTKVGHSVRTNVQMRNNARFRNQAMLPSEFLSGLMRNEQLPMNLFANHPMLSASAFEKVQELAADAAAIGLPPPFFNPQGIPDMRGSFQQRAFF